jgi:ubiquinone/menaquinone biosynthesis C-methylase UbiE
VQDRKNVEELARLELQEEMMSKAMGGLLPEQADVEPFRRVLDVGCGTGGWLIDLAKAYSHIQTLIGVDISARMVEHARSRAETALVSDRVEFKAGDALRMLEFPTNSFDLVNLRLGTSYLRTWDWPQLLREFKRVTRLGGMVRVTESDMLVKSPSATLTRLFTIACAALAQSGHFFTPESQGITSDLYRLLDQAGFQRLQSRAFTVVYRAGTPEGQLFVEDMARLFRTLQPFLRKWERVPDNYEEIYQQMLNEIQQPDFVAEGNMLTAWGYKPQVNKQSFSTSR